MRLGERAWVALQYLLPQRGLSRLVYHAARWRWRPWKNALIRVLGAAFRIDLSEAIGSGPDDYEHFNAFFTRALKPDARPLHPDPLAVLAPADGVVSQAGPILGERIIQAKDRDFAAAELLADEALARRFTNGTFCTIYLSPRDYHRVHMPVAGRLQQTRFVPGRLFSVDDTSARHIPGLFARNERLVSIFATDHGLLAHVLVGAINVSSMETVWQGEVKPSPDLRVETPADGEVVLDRGAEMGRFNMGSTVILLFEPGRVSWDAELTTGRTVRVGARIGRLLPPG